MTLSECPIHRCFERVVKGLQKGRGITSLYALFFSVFLLFLQAESLQNICTLEGAR
ncbi:hypothetical protein PORCRE_519 [Porphyromonas crevioricanis JCM 15906]|uniref:Uncharacterized protein n=1 Tax=Porphyromonas crevioricanis JCM 15906 TaxID=1305617 RepID=S4N9F7_9PORP|nr:hypothetical protein PORCRE_519 [Porphyromonas crevioricanis JCM 15906]